MLFNSFSFLFLFLPVALAGFFLLARVNRQSAAIWLALCSIAFYAWWNVSYVLLLAGSIGFNYLTGWALVSSEDRAHRQHWLLIFGVSANLGVLFYYKYMPWFGSIAHDHGLSHMALGSGIILPLGISFFTFTQIGYLVDCKQGIAKERGLINYLLFVTFFPHLIAGPILHNREIMPQFSLETTYRFSYENFAAGMTVFVAGFFKKTLIADAVAPFANAGFAHTEGLSLFAGWGAVLCYTLQLYFDFSGYSDMAIGLARMFNIRFPLNFDSPFKARSIIDFWQRWHMTLSRYLNLYLYNPIALAVTRWRAAKGYSVSRQATSTIGGFATMIVLPVFLTMTLAGIWHGAGAQFLIFGLLHASYLVINHAWRVFGLRQPKAIADSLSGRLVGAMELLLTFIAVTISFVFFRAPSVRSAMELLAAMFGRHGIEPSLVVPDWLVSLFGGFSHSLLRHGVISVGADGPIRQLVLIPVLLAIVWAVPNVQQLMGTFAPALGKVQPVPSNWPRWKPTTGWAVSMGVLAAAAVLGMGGTIVFIYFQF